jgi:hypothetical protein
MIQQGREQALWQGWGSSCRRGKAVVQLAHRENKKFQ